MIFIPNIVWFAMANYPYDINFLSYQEQFAYMAVSQITEMNPLSSKSITVMTICTSHFLCGENCVLLEMKDRK